MNLTEFKNEFDILYDSVTSNAAPPLDDYEVSVFLTQGQERFVQSIYNPLLNKYQVGFDRNEDNKRSLANLISTGINNTPKIYPNEAINQNSLFFELEDDVMYLINERVKLSSSDICYKNKVVNVLPLAYDEYNLQLSNPFKKPNDKVAWRLDNKKINEKNTVEILTADNTKASEYIYKYIKYPKPIIVGNISESINGLSVATECELDNSTHRDIVDKAVQIALEVMGNPRLQSKMNLDNINK
jgi:hypothetical protein